MAFLWISRFCHHILIYNFSNQYKCGVFLENLKPKLPLAWLGALPDKLKTVDPSEYEEILGPGITPESFQNFDCAPNAANSRCYATVSWQKVKWYDPAKKVFLQRWQSSFLSHWTLATRIWWTPSNPKLLETICVNKSEDGWGMMQTSRLMEETIFSFQFTILNVARY